MPGDSGDKSVSDTGRELWELLKAYASQETVDPLRNLGRYLGMGIPGSLLLGLGGSLLLFALLRGLQTIDALDDGLASLVPYAVTVLVGFIAVGLIARSLLPPSRGSAAEEGSR